jgi:hypothetical protein
MIYLEKFQTFNTDINKKALNMQPKEIGYLKEPVEIRIEIEKSPHADDRQFRHGLYNEKIDDDDIIETVQLAIEQLTIALMQDKFNIYQDEDDYPTRGIKRGELNRFIIHNKSNDLNLVCILKPGENEFTLIVITVMVKDDFRIYPGQFKIEVK